MPCHHFFVLRGTLLRLLLFTCFHLSYSFDHSPDIRCKSDAECEQMAKLPNFVCWSQVLPEDYSELVRIAPSMHQKASETISLRMKWYKCHTFLQLPSHIEIEMNDGLPDPYSRRRKFLLHKRRRRIKRFVGGHHRSRRQVSLGFPTPSMWDEIVPHLPTHGHHYYAPVGSKVALKCYAGHDAESHTGVLDRVDESLKTFVWTHANGMEITSHVSLDQSSGNLIFESVRLSDTGIYNCSVKGNSEETTPKGTDIYQSQLDVVAGPVYWLRFGMTFQTGRCTHKELLEIQRNVPNLVHKYACYFCTVRNVSVTCMNLGNEGGENEGRIIQLTLAMSVLGFEDLLTSWGHASVYCNLECQKTIHARILEITGGSLVKLFNLQIHVLHADGPASIYTPIPDSYDEDLADGCPPGFFLEYSLCFPCAPGKYSPTGPAECFSCEKGFFQPNPGSSACFHCPADHTTLKKGSRSQMDCILESASWWIDIMNFLTANLLIAIIAGCILLLLVLVIIALILICCCWPNSKVGRWIRCACCCGENVEEQEIPMDEEEKCLLTKEDWDSNGATSEDEESTRRKQVFDEDDDEDEENDSTEEDESSQVDYGSYGNDFSGSVYNSFRKNGKWMKAGKKVAHTLTAVRESSSAEKRALLPKPNKLDLSKYTLKRPVVPFPFRKGRHRTTIKNQKREKRELLEQQQQQEESPPEDEDTIASSYIRTPPAFPHSIEEDDLGEEEEAGENEEEDSFTETSGESSGRRRMFQRNPHLRLGNVLSKSKSLMAKLAEQRRKLRNVIGATSTDDDDSTSVRTRKTKSYHSLPSKGKTSLLALKKKFTNNNTNKSVLISESQNTYHPSSKKRSRSIFKKSKDSSGGNRGSKKSSKHKSILSKSSSSALSRIRSKSRDRIKQAANNIEKKLGGGSKIKKACKPKKKR